MVRPPAIGGWTVICSAPASMCSGRRRSNGRRIEMEKVRQRQSAAGSFYATNSPGLSCYPTGYCEIAPQGTSSRFALRAPRRFAPRNDKSGVITVLTGACTSRQRCAGSGMPLPYNSGCGRRNCFKICNCQWRSVSAATDAIGLCVFAGSLYELQVPAVFRLRILPPVRQRHEKQTKLRKIPLFFYYGVYNESAE